MINKSAIVLRNVINCRSFSILAKYSNSFQSQLLRLAIVKHKNSLMDILLKNKSVLNSAFEASLN